MNAYEIFFFFSEEMQEIDFLIVVTISKQYIEKTTRITLVSNPLRLIFLFHLRYRGAPGRLVGPAIDTAVKLFSTAPNSAGKKIAIVILTGQPQDNPAKPGQGLKKIGVIPFNIGIVPLTPAILKPLPGTTFVVDWKQLPDVVAKIRIPIIRGN